MSRMKAYLDDYNTICILVSYHYYSGESRRFFLKDSKGNLNELSIDHIENMEYLRKYICKVNNFEFEIGQNYEVYDEKGLPVNLSYRYIVETERFNNEFFNQRNDFGAHVKNGKTSFVLWAPTAYQVSLVLDPFGENIQHNMKRVEKGAFEIILDEDLHGATYLYRLRINSEIRESLDPYAYGTTEGSKTSAVIDFSKFNLDMHDDKLPEFNHSTDALIYEISVRDFSSDKNTDIEHKRKFLGMTEKDRKTVNGNKAGFDYLKDLNPTHIQLMPINDFLMGDEENQEFFYNWGYDPVQYNSLEGSYSTDSRNPISRVEEFLKLVSFYHKNKIRVNLDVVYNHMADIEFSAFEKCVPYYFFRRGQNRELSNGSFCGNDVESSRAMVRKYIVDSLLHYVRNYHVDGFRFDLMGILDIETMQDVLSNLTAEKYNIMLYGEGWVMPSIFDQRNLTTSKNARKVPGIAFFNDFYRDKVKGATSQDRKWERGYGLGDGGYLDKFKAALLANTQDIFGHKMFEQPFQSITYVESHDNSTLWDKIGDACRDESLDDKKKRQKFINGTLLLSQGIIFFQLGQEACRTKMGLDNTYNAGDIVNSLSYDYLAKYSDVYDYTVAMTKLRKELPFLRFSTSYLISRHVYMKNLDGGVLKMKFIELSNIYTHDEVHVYFNPFKRKFSYELDGKFLVLADENANSGDIIKKLELDEISIVVLAAIK